MKYLSVKQMAERWKLTDRSVRRYCDMGMIDGAFPVDGIWIIPEDAKKPVIDDNPPDPVGPAKQVIAQRAKNNHFGIYEYLQINLAYSSSRMASNRLTRNQVIELYRTGKISVAFEPMKYDDIVEIENHFRAGEYMVDTMLEPLHTAYLRKIHNLLFYGTEADKDGVMRTGEFRTKETKYGIPPKEISKAVTALLKEYESKKTKTMEDILNFHVRFEKIHPFEDGNGRVGRVLMIKECLRNQIVPFIIDDKKRGEYFRGIACWETSPDVLMTVVDHALERINNQMDTCRLLQYCRPETGRGSQNGGKKK